jgi:FtsP/CotA-like multicopper oxidase with cupredoxin domain
MLWTLILVLVTVFMFQMKVEAATVTYFLKAESSTVTMPDGRTIPIWGFADCTDGTYTTCNPVILPGPRLQAEAGDDLVINLKNNLTYPVSLVVPGQITSMSPVWVNVNDPYGPPVGTGSRPPGDYQARVRSFTHEVSPGGTGTYTWNGVKAGTYIYESGTHQAVQVQMGLYGALIVYQNSASNLAYTGISFDNEAVLLFSEIDPDFHDTVSTGNYGPGLSVTSTIDYHPRYFLINGLSYPKAVIITDHPVTPGETVIVRLLNAGLRSHVPVFENAYFKLIAEDGNLYPHPFMQYSAYLTAGKSLDLLWSPAQSGYVTVYDRMMDITNGKASPGGMIAYLSVADTTQYTLTVTKSGSGIGTVLSSSLPGGIDCGTDCTESYNNGTKVSLSAIPDTGFTFLGWSGDCTGAGTCTVKMKTDRNVTATFEKKVAVLSPNGGESLPSGGNYMIQWTAVPEAVKFILRYSCDGGASWTRIAKNVTGLSYNWSVPVVTNPHEDNCLVRVTGFDAANTKLGRDQSDTPFSIKAVIVISPNGGESFTQGEQIPINWTTYTTISPVVKTLIRYSIDGGATWQTSAVLSGNPGVYVWTTPLVSSTTVKIKVSLKDATNKVVARDRSDGNFTIN